MVKRATIAVTMLMGCMLMSSPSHAVLYEFSWSGPSGPLTGQFSYDDSLHETGLITESQLDSFSMTALGATWDYFSDPLTGIMNFNFNTTTGLFGSGYWSAGGQAWNWNSGNPTDLGFIAAGPPHFSTYSRLHYGGTYHSIAWHNNITATLLRGPEIPEPAILSLMGLGLAGLGWSRRKPH